MDRRSHCLSPCEQTLELGYNPIGVEGAKAFSDLLKYDMKVGRPFIMLAWLLCKCL